MSRYVGHIQAPGESREPWSEPEYGVDVTFVRVLRHRERGRWGCRSYGYPGDCSRWRTAEQCCEGGDFKVRPGWRMWTVTR